MNTQTCKPVTAAQIKKIHTLLNQRGLTDEKEMIIHFVSRGRTSSTKELTCMEAKHLITLVLKGEAEIRGVRKEFFETIYFIAWEMGIIYGETEDDHQMNIAKLNMFCRQRGTVKKNLTEMNLPEMHKTLRQFQAMYKRHLNSLKTLNKQQSNERSKRVFNQ